MDLRFFYKKGRHMEYRQFKYVLKIAELGNDAGIIGAAVLGL